MADQCKNGCGKAADAAFAGCCSTECFNEFMGGTPPKPVTQEFLTRLRSNVESVEVDLDAPLPPEEDDTEMRSSW
jgi:hypothetical protein